MLTILIVFDSWDYFDQTVAIQTAMVQYRLWAQ